MLPSISALRAFEATVRTGSVRAAARELNVVHGAVSQHIRTLEDLLGLPLFERKGRTLVLTERGRRYSNAINVAFSIIERAGEEIRPSGTARPFRLGMMSALASYWFVPIMAKYANESFGVEIELVTTSTQSSLHGNELDAIIVAGEYEPRPEIFGEKIMDDLICPVASPEMVERANLNKGLENLEHVTGIGSLSSPRLWETWFYEAEHPAIRFQKRVDLENLMLVIEAARAGMGVAMTPFPHVAEDLKSGRLIAPFGVLKRHGGHYFCCRAHDASLRPYRLVRELLVREGARTAVDS